MDNFKKGGYGKDRGGSFGGRPKFGGNKKFGAKFGGGRDGGNRPAGRMELFPAVCAECKKNCEVPFRPTGDKPVYCRDCFGKQRHVPGRNSNGADGPRPDFRRDEASRQYQSEYTQPQHDAGVDALKRQLDSLESKVNRILELMYKKAEPAAAAAAIAPVVSRVPKVKKAKAAVGKVVKGKK